MKIALCTALWAGFAAGATFAGPWKDESDKGRCAAALFRTGGVVARWFLWTEQA